MVNWERVGELRSDFGDEDFNEIVSLFLSEVEERLGCLRKDDPADLKDDLHFLKGSAANLGFDRFRSECQDLERDPARFDLAALTQVYTASKAEFLSGCAKQGLVAT
ncbi:MAG: Hpt domain-containing protein [Paracoccaceae bacterium]